MRKVLLFVCMLLGVFSVYAQRPWQVGSEVSVYQEAPNFKVKMSDGRTLELKKLRGKVVFLDFGGITCGPCIAAQKTFKEKLFDKYSPKDLVVIPVLSGSCKGWEEIEAFQKRHGFDFPFGWDPEYSIGYMKKGAGVPQWYVINRFGIITALGSDESFPEAVEAAVQQKKKVKERVLHGGIFMLAPESRGRKIVAINGYVTDAVIDPENPDAERLLKVVETAMRNNHQVDLTIEEGTLRVLEVKELDELFRKPARKVVRQEEKVDYSKGVVFEDLSLNDALEKAKRENKRVFIDTYTVWCGPCKTMDRYMFPLESVGNFFKEHFISLKFDIDKGEGKEIAQKYGIKNVPTYVILSQDGTEYHRMVGGRNTDEEFLAELSHVLSNRKYSLPYLDSLYASGNMPRGEYREYLHALTKAYNLKQAEVVMKDLKTKIGPEEKNHPDNWAVLEAAEFGSDDYKYVVEHRADLAQTIGQDELDKFFNYHYTTQLSQFLYGPRELKSLLSMQSLFNRIQQDFKILDFKGKEKLEGTVALLDAAIKQDSVLFSSLLRDMVDSKQPDNENAALFIGSLVGNSSDLEYLLSRKEEMYKYMPQASYKSHWDERFKWVNYKLTHK